MTTLKQKLIRIHAAFGAIRERNFALNDPVIDRTCNDAMDDAYLLITELNNLPAIEHESPQASSRENAKVREVAPRKKNRDVAPTAESGPDKRVLAASDGLMSSMPHNEKAQRPLADSDAERKGKYGTT